MQESCKSGNTGCNSCVLLYWEGLSCSPVSKRFWMHGSRSCCCSGCDMRECILFNQMTSTNNPSIDSKLSRRICWSRFQKNYQPGRRYIQGSNEPPSQSNWYFEAPWISWSSVWSSLCWMGTERDVRNILCRLLINSLTNIWFIRQFLERDKAPAVRYAPGLQLDWYSVCPLISLPV